MLNFSFLGRLKAKVISTGIIRVIIISLLATITCIGIIKAATNIGSNVFTDGTITGGGANTFYGATSVGGALTATSTLAVNGATTLYGALTSYGDATLSNLTATGTLAVSGLTTLSKALKLTPYDGSQPINGCDDDNDVGQIYIDQDTGSTNTGICLCRKVPFGYEWTALEGECD